MSPRMLGQPINTTDAPSRCDGLLMPHHLKTPSAATLNPTCPPSTVHFLPFTRPYEQAKTPTSNLYLPIQSP